MTNSADLIIDGKAIDAATDKLIRRYLGAGTRAVSTTARDLEQDLEAATQRAVPGRLWRAWQSSTFPRSGPARAPVGTVFLKGRADGRTGGAIKFWSQPGAIRGKAGQFLAVPLPSAGSRGRARDLTPEEWERRTGQKLKFVPRRGRPPLLVVENSTLNGRTGVARPLTDRRKASGRGAATIPIFVLLPVVRFRNAFAIEPLVNAAEGDLARNFLDETRGITLR